jgi:hypothetical protein
MTAFSKTKVIGVRAGVTPRRTPEQLADLTYYVEASAADGRGTSVCKLLSAALTGNSLGGANAEKPALDDGKATQKPTAS